MTTAMKPTERLDAIRDRILKEFADGKPATTPREAALEGVLEDLLGLAMPGAVRPERPHDPDAERRERTSAEIAALASKGLNDPAALKPNEVRRVCASALTQFEGSK